MSHASYDAADRAANGITDGLIRASVGLEATEDFRKDLDDCARASMSESRDTLCRLGKL